MTKGISKEGQLVARPPIHPATFDSLQPDKLNDVFIYYEDQQPDQSSYRYKLTVADRRLLPTTSSPPIKTATAVFLIPAGRESEYMFTSHTSLQQIAESAQTARLIAVSFGRNHEFASQESVQRELTFAVQVLSRQGMFLPTFLSKLREQTEIPFLAMDGIGERNVIAEGDSAMSGRYLVEQVKAGEQMVRRLYFMENPFVIQSEVVLVNNDNANAAATAAIDKSLAAFEYHIQMAAGVLGLTDNGTAATTGLMVGLGGGGLVNFLQYLLPDASHQLTAVELDPTVVQVAKEYFGVTVAAAAAADGGESGATVHVGDGLCICADTDKAAAARTGAIPLPAESLSFLAIDVDSKDKSVGMSCPPIAFVETAYLEQIAKLLQPEGVLVINVSARDPSMLELVCRNVQGVFPKVILCRQEAEEQERTDVNVVLFALLTETDLPPKDALVENLERAVAKDQVDATVLAGLRDCLDDLQSWGAAATAKNKEAGGGKKKPKRNKKKGKRK